jgi:hypothetical protein
MLQLCPYYENNNCMNPNDSRTSRCSWGPPKDYHECMVYRLIQNPSDGREAIRKALGGRFMIIDGD